MAATETSVISRADIRLEGITIAPAHSPQGLAAAGMLRGVGSGKRVTCRTRGDNLVSRATTEPCRADGGDIPAVLIASGSASET